MSLFAKVLPLVSSYRNLSTRSLAVPRTYGGTGPTYQSLRPIRIHQIHASAFRGQVPVVRKDSDVSEQIKIEPRLYVRRQRSLLPDIARDRSHRMTYAYTNSLIRRRSITFTCTADKCNHRSSHEFTKRSYEKGIVLVQCPKCKNRFVQLSIERSDWWTKYMPQTWRAD